MESDKYALAAQQIAASHALIQTKPRDRLDCLSKTAAIKQVILGCVAQLDQLHRNPAIVDYSEDDLARIHESVCVAAIPLLNLMEYFLELAKEEVMTYSLAV